MDEDRRQWVGTDRPGERMAVALPAAGVRVFSVTGSDRHCKELHEDHTVCVLHAGQPRVAAVWRSGRGHSFESESGSVMVMELGEVHRTTCVHGKVSFSVIQLAPSLVREAAAQLGLGRVRVRAASLPSAELHATALRLVQASACSSDALTLGCLLTDFVRTWLGHCGEDRLQADPVVHRGIRRARDALRECALVAEGQPECPRLEQLAALSGLSAARFPHAFKQWLGLSAHAYFNTMRLNGARRRLERGASATDVAAAFGFADLPHFSRHFRRQFGLPPRAWSRLSRPTAARGRARRSRA